MNEFIKYFGIVLILIGVGILGYYGTYHLTTNTPLVIAMLLLLGGLVTYIVLNRIFT
ncbi:MAG: hypothetical protein GXO47_00505 [Chlorobi bacterium]|nr:hypothetical protein [Chlorobiota bacterium]